MAPGPPFVSAVNCQAAEAIIVTDFTHKDALGKLVRYESSHTEKGKTTSLADYVKRMSSEQKEIYCLLAPNRAAAESSPYFEVFRERKWEVLFLYDPWDEFVMEHLHHVLMIV